MKYSLLFISQLYTDNVATRSGVACRYRGRSAPGDILEGHGRSLVNLGGALANLGKYEHWLMYIFLSYSLLKLRVEWSKKPIWGFILKLGRS